MNMKWGALVPPVEDVNAFPALLPGLPLNWAICISPVLVIC